MTESIETMISFDVGRSFETTQVVPLGSDRYRLEATPISSESVSFGDIIEAGKDSDGYLLFRSLITKSELQSFQWLLSAAVVESPQFAAFCDRIMSEGGMWERVLGGLVFVHLPSSYALDPEKEISRIIKAIEDESSSQ